MKYAKIDSDISYLKKEIQLLETLKNIRVFHAKINIVNMRKQDMMIVAHLTQHIGKEMVQYELCNKSLRSEIMIGKNERLLYEILNESYPNKWESDIIYLEGKGYRGDAVSKEYRVVVEIDGGMHPFWITLKNGTRKKVLKGGHTTPEGIERDMNKANESQLQGWKLLRFTPDTLKNRPWMIISAVRRACGYDDAGQQTLDLTGCKQARLNEVQVHIS